MLTQAFSQIKRTRLSGKTSLLLRQKEVTLHQVGRNIKSVSYTPIVKFSMVHFASSTSCLDQIPQSPSKVDNR